MQTACPHCQTVFRVTGAALTARRGWVRCGVCERAFDALPGLADEAEPLPIAAAELPELTGTVRAEATPEIALRREIDPPPSGPDPVPAPKAGRRRVRRWLRGAAWTVAALLMLGLLLGQVLRMEHARIVEAVPTLAPAIERFCRRLPCAAAALAPEADDPPRRAAPNDAFAIVARDVRPHPERPAALLVNVTFENRADHARALPGLGLSLLDAETELLASRVFMPAEYMSAESDPADDTAGTRGGAPRQIAAGRALHVVLELAMPATRPHGYEFFFVNLSRR